MLLDSYLIVLLSWCVLQMTSTELPGGQTEDLVFDKTNTRLTPQGTTDLPSQDVFDGSTPIGTFTNFRHYKETTVLPSRDVLGDSTTKVTFTIPLDNKETTVFHSQDALRGSTSKGTLTISRDYKETTDLPNIPHIVYWNKSMSPEEFHWTFCPFRCLKGNLITIQNNSNCSYIFCYRCSCRRPSCEFYKLCCPDLSETETLPPGVRYEIKIIENSTDDTLPHLPDRGDDVPKLSCRTIFDISYDPSVFFLTIRSCPKSYSSSPDVVRQCVDDVPLEEVTTRNYFWVEDNATGVLYHNMFCAICNGVLQAEIQAVNAHCEDYMPVYQITTEDEMLRSVLRLKPHCLIEKYQPKMARLYPCTPGVTKTKKVVAECRSDLEQDADVVKACKELSGYIYITTSADRKMVYQNIFCAMCNADSSLSDAARGVCRKGGGNVLKDNTNYVYDPKRTVVVELPDTLTLFYNLSWPMQCASGKILLTNCTTAFSFVRGLSYRLRLWLVPVKAKGQTQIETVEIDVLLLKMEKLLQMFASNYFVFASQLKPTGKTLVERQVEIYWLDAQFDGILNTSRDSLESDLVQTFIQKELTINGVPFRPLLMKQGYTKDDFCGFQNSSSEIYVVCISEGRGDYYQASSESIVVAMTLVCSFVTFSKDDYNITTNLSSLPPNITIALNLNVTVIYFWEFSELNLMEVEDDGSLNVCHELLQLKTKDFKRMVRVSRYNRPTEYIANDVVGFSQYVLAMICLSLSVLCLLVTLIIYSWLPSLQTSAGINNMGLSVSLLLAQLITIAAYQSPGAKSLCTSLGVLSHFTWLWMFTWTFICSLHIYQVFKSNNGSAAQLAGSQVNVTLKKIGVSLLFPLLVVVTVVLTSYFTSGNVGYGSDICYLNSAFIVGVSIVTPLSVISLCNLTLFLLTILHIHRVRQLQTFSTVRDEDRNFLHVYVRLSSVTGSLWVVSIIAEATDNDVLRHMSIVLNGLQGVLLFISFICNKRVVTQLSHPVQEEETMDATTGMNSRS